MNYVYETTGLKRYRFPTHVNELVVDRSACKASEVFVVILDPGEAPPLHKHDDTEQVYYIIEGQGTLTIGEDKQTFPVKAGQVVVVPPATWHSIRAEGAPVRYIAVDSFVTPEGKLEDTWEEHVRVVCGEQGWKFEDVVQ